MSQESTHKQYSYPFIALIKYNNFTMIFCLCEKYMRFTILEACSGNSNTLTYFIDKNVIASVFLR